MVGIVASIIEGILVLAGLQVMWIGFRRIRNSEKAEDEESQKKHLQAGSIFVFIGILITLNSAYHFVKGLIWLQNH